MASRPASTRRASSIAMTMRTTRDSRPIRVVERQGGEQLFETTKPGRNGTVLITFALPADELHGAVGLGLLRWLGWSARFWRACSLDVSAEDGMPVASRPVAVVAAEVVVSAPGLAGYRGDCCAGRVPWDGLRGRMRLRSP